MEAGLWGGDGVCIIVERWARILGRVNIAMQDSSRKPDAGLCL